MENLKKMKKEIKELKESTPEGQFRTGLYITKIGNKYIHVLDTWEEISKIEKFEIEYFYNTYIK